MCITAKAYEINHLENQKIWQANTPRKLVESKEDVDKMFENISLNSEQTLMEVLTLVFVEVSYLDIYNPIELNVKHQIRA